MGILSRTVLELRGRGPLTSKHHEYNIQTKYSVCDIKREKAFLNECQKLQRYGSLTDTIFFKPPCRKIQINAIVCIISQ